jgi:hypothetical protein
MVGRKLRLTLVGHGLAFAKGTIKGANILCTLYLLQRALLAAITGSKKLYNKNKYDSNAENKVYK